MPIVNFPDPIRRAIQRSSLTLGITGLVVVGSAITTLATLDGSSSSSPRPSQRMTLSAIEEESTTTTTMWTSTTDVEVPSMPSKPASTTTTVDTVTADPDELVEKVNNHEERLGRLEETVAATTTTTTKAAAPDENSSTTTTTVPARTRDTTTTTTAPQGEWTEIARFEGVNPPQQTPTLTTGYVRCVRSRDDGEADPEILQRMGFMTTWKDVCTLSGPDGTVSPVFRLVGSKPLQVVNHTVGTDWVFGLIVEEYRCVVAGCTMPAVG